MRVVCSAGGTGGHIFPAVAVAQEIKKRYPDASILFVGAKGKMEMTKVPKAGFDIKGLWISGLHRRLTFKNLLFPIKLFFSLIGALRILVQFKPQVVAGFGGYASGATLWVASKIGIPTLILEQNSYAGITNKLLNGSVDRVCLAYEEAEKYFSKSQILLTGNPIRSGLKTELSMRECREKMSLDPDLRTVLFLGGSQGARSINKALASAHDRIEESSNLQIIWQCGQGYYDEYKSCKSALIDHVHIMPFIENMALAYGASDLVVCRSGALTIAELMHLAKPSILVPSPNVAEDHQTKNAMALVNKNAAVILQDQRLAELLDVIEETLNDEVLLKKLSSNIEKMNRPNAVQMITDELEQIMKK